MNAPFGKRIEGLLGSTTSFRIVVEVGRYVGLGPVDIGPIVRRLCGVGYAVPTSLSRYEARDFRAIQADTPLFRLGP